MTEPGRLYYFTPTKYALEGVKNCRLKVAELDKANDPFEGLPFRWDEGLTEDKLDKIFSEFQSNISKHVKIICFSETYKEPLLWGQYADNCKGICLGFDIISKPVKDLCSKVEYTKHKMDKKKFGFSDSKKEDDDNFIEFLLHKSHHWKHEKEWRMWLPENLLDLDATTGLYFFPFARPTSKKASVQILKLREILIGFRCDEENIKRRFEKLTKRDPDPVEKFSKHDLDPPEIFFTRRSSSTFEILKVT